MVSHASSQNAINTSRIFRAAVRSESRNAFFASCCVIVLPPWSRPRDVMLWTNARAMPCGSIPQCERKRRSSIARNALVTFFGSFAASTDVPTIAPRRAIGVPSSASRVTLGGVGGCNDFDSGAVTASHATASTNSTISAANARMIHRIQLIRRLGRRG